MCCGWHQVAKYSMLKYASVPVEVIPLKRNELQVIPVTAHHAPSRGATAEPARWGERGDCARRNLADWQ